MITPGPWKKVKQKGGARLIVASESGRGICAIIDWTKSSRPEDNDALLAAAPDLLHVARAAWHALKSYECGNRSEDLAREIAAALEKTISEAEGRTNSPRAETPVQRETDNPPEATK